MPNTSEKLRHKPSTKHTLEEVLSSLQDLIRNDLPPSDQSETSRAEKPHRPRQPKPAESDAQLDKDQVLRSLRNLISTDTGETEASADTEAKQAPTPDATPTDTDAVVSAPEEPILDFSTESNDDAAAQSLDEFVENLRQETSVDLESNFKNVQPADGDTAQPTVEEVVFETPPEGFGEAIEEQSLGETASDLLQDPPLLNEMDSLPPLDADDAAPFMKEDISLESDIDRAYEPSTDQVEGTETIAPDATTPVEISSMSGSDRNVAPSQPLIEEVNIDWTESESPADAESVEEIPAPSFDISEEDGVPMQMAESGETLDQAPPDAAAPSWNETPEDQPEPEVVEVPVMPPADEASSYLFNHTDASDDLPVIDVEESFEENLDENPTGEIQLSADPAMDAKDMQIEAGLNNIFANDETENQTGLSSGTTVGESEHLLTTNQPNRSAYSSSAYSMDIDYGRLSTFNMKTIIGELARLSESLSPHSRGAAESVNGDAATVNEQESMEIYASDTDVMHWFNIVQPETAAVQDSTPTAPVSIRNAIESEQFDVTAAPAPEPTVTDEIEMVRPEPPRATATANPEAPVPSPAKSELSLVEDDAPLMHVTDHNDGEAAAPAPPETEIVAAPPEPVAEAPMDKPPASTPTATETAAVPGPNLTPSDMDALPAGSTMSLEDAPAAVFDTDSRGFPEPAGDGEAKKPLAQSALDWGDDIPVLENVAAAGKPGKRGGGKSGKRKTGRSSKASNASLRDIAIKVIAKMNIDLRKRGERALAPAAIDQLQKLLRDALDQKTPKDHNKK